MINNNQLNISYSTSSIKSITSTQTFKLNTKGKFLIDDLTVAATITTPLIDDANAVNADLREGVTAYGNNNIELTGTIPNYGGMVTINPIVTWVNTKNGNVLTIVGAQSAVKDGNTLILS